MRSAILMFAMSLLGISLYAVTQGFPQHTIKDQEPNRELPPDIREQLQTPSLSATLPVPVLLYHYVEYVKNAKDTIRKSMDTTPNIFEEQIQTIKNAGYTFMTAGELADVLSGKRKLAQKPIILTFDDGYRDFYTDVFPILKKYHVKATAYIVSGFLDKPNSMLTSQVEEIAKSGLVEIGAHTAHHIALKGKPEKLVMEEILESKTMLEDKFHVHIISFAYPDGAFDKQAINIVKDVGFQTAVSTIPGIGVSEQNRFFIYRIRPGGRTGNDLLNYLEKTTFKH